MPEALEDLLSRLREDRTLFLSGEEATRQGAVLPILARLGWDRDNVREVVPEFSVGNGRVDYCLRVGERNAVFIEVKRTSQDLEQHQEQLLEYAFRANSIRDRCAELLALFGYARDRLQVEVQGG